MSSVFLQKHKYIYFNKNLTFIKKYDIINYSIIYIIIIYIYSLYNYSYLVY